MNDYPSWKSRFHTYVLGQNTELWTCFTTPFNEALDVAVSNLVTLAGMAEGDKKAYDLEKKAFAILKQAIHKDIIINSLILPLQRICGTSWKPEEKEMQQQERSDMIC
ncbi:hypothetical protein HanRHA438_Chr03g0105661 [Helianthus annuus]|nr:hypothetical protein HanIR_Chr03g0103171 [Helianthus annuus]KAJ0934284.1 hypothetical protein HanRHA438_Chr03g0105661 [Helianthus annuus]